MLSTTIETEGASEFLFAIRKQGLVDKLDNRPRITVFAPLGKLHSNCTVEGQIVSDYLGYSPEFVPGTTYGGITITKKGESFYANGLKIVKADVPVKNGIVHYLESV